MRKKVLYRIILILISTALLLVGCQDTSTNGSDKTEEPKDKTETPAPTEATEAPPDEKLEPVELVWYSLVDYERPDTDMVWEEINKFLCMGGLWRKD